MEVPSHHAMMDPVLPELRAALAELGAEDSEHPGHQHHRSRIPVRQRCSMPTTGRPTCATRCGFIRPSPPPAPLTAPSSRSARTPCSPKPSPTPWAACITTASAPCNATPTTPTPSTPTSTPPTPPARHTPTTPPNHTRPSPPLPGTTLSTGSRPHLRSRQTNSTNGFGVNGVHAPMPRPGRRRSPQRLALRADLARSSVAGRRHRDGRAVARLGRRRPGRGIRPHHSMLA